MLPTDRAAAAYDVLVTRAWSQWQEAGRQTASTPSIQARRAWFGAHAWKVLPQLELVGRSVEPELKDWINEAKLAKASTRLDQWFGWVPPRILPVQIRDETFGAALDRIRTVRARRGIALESAIGYAATGLVFLCEIVRYVVRSGRGSK